MIEEINLINLLNNTSKFRNMEKVEPSPSITTFFIIYGSSSVPEPVNQG